MSNTIDEEVSNNVCCICNSEAAPNIKKCTSCDQKIRDGVCDNNFCITNTTSSIKAVSIDIDNMNISNSNNITSTGADSSISICANCGKEGDDVNNICNKCKVVKYCNASCKKKHRSKHKTKCEEHVRLAAEHAAKLHDIELFKQPPSNGDCPICFIRLPLLSTGWRYNGCCGKTICSGCCYAPLYDNQGNKVDNEKCAFCRAPWPNTHEEGVERGKKRAEAGEANAMHSFGCYYSVGLNGFPQDYNKALELFHRAAELGDLEAYCEVGLAYYEGRGVETDKRKANYYFQLAAMGGNAIARYNLGLLELTAGNIDRALKHHMIAVRDGYTKSLEQIKLMYSNGDATKGDYTKALQLYQTYLEEIKSVQRDKAAADDEKYRYY